MCDDSSTSSSGSSRLRDDVLTLGPQKKPCVQYISSISPLTEAFVFTDAILIPSSHMAGILGEQCMRYAMYRL